MNFWPNFKENKPFAVLLIILLVVVVVALLGVVRNDWKEYRYIGKAETRDTITIQGQGEVTAVPDIATVAIGLSTEKKEVADAQKENTDKMNAFIKDIKGLDIEKEDITTTNYNIYPRYDYDDGKQVLRGYEVSQNVSVKIRDLEKISDVLSLVSTHKLNQVGGLNFTFDDPEELKQEARVAALENATEKAEDLADVAGVKLGKIVSFSESSADYEFPVRYAAEASALGIGGGGEAPQVEAGSQDITVYVTVSYEVY